MVNRKVTYRLYPTLKQSDELLEMLVLHQRLYNAAIEQRIKVWRGWGKALSGTTRSGHKRSEGVLIWGARQRVNGREPAMCGAEVVTFASKHETPSIPLVVGW
jgi:hypothetical protein